jgi:hypothetical protein
MNINSLRNAARSLATQTVETARQTAQKTIETAKSLPRPDAFEAGGARTAFVGVELRTKTADTEQLVRVGGLATLEGRLSARGAGAKQAASVGLTYEEQSRTSGEGVSSKRGLSMFTGVAERLEASAGVDGGSLGAEAFAGLKAQVSAGLEGQVGALEGRLTGMVGVGVTASGHATNDAGRRELSVGGEAGGALGVGAAVGGDAKLRY